MSFKGLHHWLCNCLLEKMQFGFELKRRVILGSFGNEVAKKLHPQHSVHDERQKNLNFFVLQSSELPVGADDSNVHDFLCVFARFESFLLLGLFHVVAELEGNSLVELKFVLIFDCKCLHNGLAQIVLGCIIRILKLW